jgi:hypothetical protein
MAIESDDNPVASQVAGREGVAELQGLEVGLFGHGID